MHTDHCPTANALQGDRYACLRAGLSDYPAKRFKQAKLEHILLRWLSECSH